MGNWSLIPIMFVGMWLGISALLSLGGWRALAKTYRHTARPEGKPFPFSAMSLGVTRYKGCVLAHLNDKGLALSVYLPFRFCHPNLFIPWSAVIDCHRERHGFRDCTRLTLSESQTPMRIYGSLSKAIHEFRRSPL
jgi:hypothetical protein